MEALHAGASDVFFTEGQPVQIRKDGRVEVFMNQPLTTLKRLVVHLLVFYAVWVA